MRLGKNRSVIWPQTVQSAEIPPHCEIYFYFSLNEKKFIKDSLAQNLFQQHEKKASRNKKVRICEQGVSALPNTLEQGRLR